MTKDVVIPDWLERLINQVLDSDDWPDSQYPTLAMGARDRIGEYQDEDGQASLLQLVINDVERLQRHIVLLEANIANPVMVELLRRELAEMGSGNERRETSQGTATSR